MVVVHVPGELWHRPSFNRDLHHRDNPCPVLGLGVLDASSEGKNTTSTVTGVEVMNIFMLVAGETRDNPTFKRRAAAQGVADLARMSHRIVSSGKKRNWSEQKKKKLSLRTQPRIQQTHSITDNRRNVMTKKHSTVPELIGKKSFVNCYTQGKRTQVLWDTGSQVSAIDETWKADNLPDIQLRDIAEIVDPDNPLQIEAANGTEMPYVGWVEVTVRLVGSTAEFHVPILFMKGNQQLRPIIGFNVIKHVVTNSQTKEGNA